MNNTKAAEILAELETLDTHLGWREEKGTLRDNEYIALYLVQIVRPFLKTLTDIAISLEDIANNLDRLRQAT